MQVKQVVKLRYARLLRRICPYALVWALCMAGAFPEAMAQQEGNQLTQYMLNTYAYNAGFAGMSNGIAASLLYRLQWGGIGNVGTNKTDGTSTGSGSGSFGTSSEKANIAPYSIIAMADMPIKAIHGAVGIGISSYKAAQWQDLYIKLGYTYHIQTSIGLIGLGLRGQVLSKSLDISGFNPENSSDPLLSGSGEEAKGIYGDVSVGFYLQGNGGYSVGVGVNNLIAHKNQKIAYKPSRTAVLHAAYSFKAPNLPKVEFTPSTYLETDFHTVNWQVAFVGTFNQRFWAGLSYRLQDAVCILAGVNVEKLKIGVSYDISASKWIRASKMGGSIEVMLKYVFGLEGEKANTEYKNARYL